MKEVKLEINVDKILKACKAINTEGSNVHLSKNTPKEHLSMLEEMFKDDNLKIESAHNDKEKECILKIVKSRASQHFAYNANGAKHMSELHDALMGKEGVDFQTAFISVLEELIKPNTLIYSPAHGIKRRVDRNEPLENITLSDGTVDPSPRACTLEIDDARFLGLESLLQFTEEGLDRKNFSAVSCLPESKDIVSNIHCIEEYYNLPSLYTKEYKDTGIPLVDYGLKIIHEKYDAIKKLNKEIGETEANSDKNQKEKINENIETLFGSGGLDVVVSVLDSLEEIKHEKIMHSKTIKAIECMASNGIFLDETDGKNRLQMTNNLNYFYKKYIDSTGLVEKLNKKIIAMDSKIKDEKVSLDAEKAKYKEVEAHLKALEGAENSDSQEYEQEIRVKNGEMETIRRTVNNLEHEIYLLECEREKENMDHKNIELVLLSLDLLSRMSLNQKKYFVKKIEKHAKMLGVEVETVGPSIHEEEEISGEKYPFLTETTRTKIIKAFMFIYAFIIITILLIHTKNDLIEYFNS
ncbi:hypothetical protein NEMIN01_2254 [Nematocida minor]|uniref:uncharacterized protein n=1 Tax=Nematocida minor TaxID=1912983 RepID=UPI00221FFDD7|nr:uncharacterized protein NEMIN01_2254 [Nematocida minor]KAI5192868.1 hypothetical protein NEMIN01_2254 [Nematocida minor]